MTIVNRLLLITLPLWVLPILAVSTWIGLPLWDGLTRAIVALCVITYSLGILAALWVALPKTRTPPAGGA